MKAGVQEVDLDLHVLANADASFRDLRLMRDGKQQPYLIERTSITSGRCRSFLSFATRNARR